MVLVIIIGIIILFRLDVSCYPAFFFLFSFMGSIMFDFERVRNKVFFQLIVIAILLGILTIRRNGKIYLKDYLFGRIIPGLLLFLVFNIVIGVVLGNSKFQVFVDCYKYLEIIVYFVLLRMSWRNNAELIKGVKLLVFEMLVLGIIESFTSERGGIGLNLIVSLFPIAFLLSSYGYLRYNRTILTLSFLFVAMCQTRTYIVGFVLGFVSLIFFMPKQKRKSLLNTTLVMGIVGIIIVGVFGSQFLNGTLSRFSELSQGLIKSGGYRIYDYKEAFDRFLESPIIGQGFGYLKLTYIELMGWIYWGDFVHNIYLEILFKVGLVGTGFLLILFGIYVKKTYCSLGYFKEQNEFMFSICCGSICALIAWLFIYSFAPLTTIGSMFMGPLISSIAVSNWYESTMLQDGCLGSE